MNTPRLAHIPATPLAILTVRALGTGFLMYGLVILAQGQQRWTGPQFGTATSLAPSSVWGALFAVLGFVVLLGHFTYLFALRNVGLYGAGVLLLTFSLSVWREALYHDNVSFAGPIFPVTIAVVTFIIARAREVDPDAGLA